MRPPLAWRIVSKDLWLLDDREAKAFWFALGSATRTRPQAMRQAFALAGQSHVSEQFWQSFASPPAVMACLEDLVAEGRLRRRQATRIEEQVLRHVTAEGVWRGDSPGPARQTTHPPDVVTFAEVGRT